jgi:acyl carrier protein
MNETIQQSLKTLLAKIMQVEQALINDEASTANLENWDSLRHMKLIIALEEEYGLVFDEYQIETMTSFSGILTAMQQAIKCKSG